MTRQLFQYHPTIGYQFIPGLKARVEHESGGYLVRTNGAGFRCRHEFAKKRARGTFRVLLFGNSYTAGDGVSDKARYGDLLESLLPNVEVFNFGLSGTGTDQHYLIWREWATHIEHDLVIIGVLVENIRRVVSRYLQYKSNDGEDLILAKPYFTLERDGSLKLHQVPVPQRPIPRGSLARDDRKLVDQGGRFLGLRRAINRATPRIKEYAQRLTRYQPVPNYDRPDHPDWRLLKAILQRWISEIRVPTLICPIPLYHHVEGTASAKGYRERFQSLHEPPRVIVHDPLPDFLCHSPEERRRFRFECDCHLTPAAHRILAESLARCIAPFASAQEL